MKSQAHSFSFIYIDAFIFAVFMGTGSRNHHADNSFQHYFRYL